MSGRARTVLAYAVWLSVVAVTRAIHHQLDEPIRFWSTTAQMVAIAALAVHLCLKTKRMDRDLFEAKTRLDVISEVATAGLVANVEAYLEDAGGGDTIHL